MRNIKFLCKIFIAGLLLLLMVQCSQKVKNNIPVCKVVKGPFDIEVVETGELSAVNAINISSPAMSWRYGSLKVIKIIEDGTEVKKGRYSYYFRSI